MSIELTPLNRNEVSSAVNQDSNALVAKPSYQGKASGFLGRIYRYILPQSLKTNNIMNRLPFDLGLHLFDFMTAVDVKKLSFLCKSITNVTKDTSKTTETYSLRCFIDSMIKNLDGEKFSSQKSSLKEISEKIDFSKCTNLIEEKSHILEIKKQLIDVLKTLRMQDINNLDADLKPSNFMEDILNVAKRERRCEIFQRLHIDENSSSADNSLENHINQSSNIDEKIEYALLVKEFNSRLNCFKNICTPLIRLGRIDESVKVAMVLKDLAEKDLMLSHISACLVKLGSVERSIEIVMMITDLHQQDAALCYILKYLVQHNNVEKSLEIARMFEDPLKHAKILSKISNYLVEHGSIDRGIQVAMTISDKQTRSLCLQKNCANLLNTEIEKCIEIAQMISHLPTKNSTFSIISESLLKDHNNTIRAIEVTMMITDSHEYMDALFRISDYFLQNSDIDTSIEVALLIENLSKQVSSLNNIFSYLLRNGNIDRSIEVAKFIDHLCGQTTLLSYLSKYLKKEAMYLRAIEVDWYCFNHSNEISKLFSKRGLHDQAYEQAKKSYNIAVDNYNFMKEIGEFSKLNEAEIRINEASNEIKKLRKKTSYSHSLREGYAQIRNYLDADD